MFVTSFSTHIQYSTLIASNSHVHAAATAVPAKVAIAFMLALSMNSCAERRVTCSWAKHQSRHDKDQAWKVIHTANRVHRNRNSKAWMGSNGFVGVHC